jgi:hypothetical protein
LNLLRKSCLKFLPGNSSLLLRQRTSKPTAAEALPGRRKGIRPIGKHWENKPDVIFRGDREICNPGTPGGCAEYKWRVLLMWIRQDGICCNCPYPLALKDATFEHENGRTSGRRDDRIALFDVDGSFLRHLNGVSHLACNSRRGSRRTEIQHGNNAVFERVKL